MDQVDVIVVGAGVVGLAVARELAVAGSSVVLIEREGGFGAGVSSRNSEVIHAGLYYPPGSLKAQLCVRGKHLLYEFAQARGVPHRRCGKLIVATSEAELPALDTIASRAAEAGVSDLQRLDRAQCKAIESQVEALAALISPSSGIVDSHALMTALLAEAEAHGALLALRSPFDRARRAPAGWVVHTAGSEPFEIGCRWIIDAAGIAAQAVALAIESFPGRAIPPQRLAKGHYFALPGRAPFSRLVYPTPVDGGLGVHLTLDLGGQARFGPDVEWLPAATDEAALDYAVDPTRREAFEASVRRYWPGLPAGALQPAYTGVRPKLSGPGEPAADFVIDGPARHGVPGVVALFGIESPGLTASLAIAERVRAIVTDQDGRA
jgi:L-2-hydroxyglutarate oxidase LhgO